MGPQRAASVPATALTANAEAAGADERDRESAEQVQTLELDRPATLLVERGDLIAMRESDCHQHHDGDDEGRRPREETDDHEQRRDHFADIGQGGDRSRQACCSIRPVTGPSQLRALAIPCIRMRTPITRRSSNLPSS